MSKLLPLAAAVLVSFPAWATGERVVLVPANNPLKDNLCISMTCVAGGAREATVAVRPAGNAWDITVTTAAGAVRLNHRMPTSADGLVSSTDLLHAVTLAVIAIEGGAVKVDPPAVRSSAPVKAKAPKASASSGALAKAKAKGKGGRPGATIPGRLYAKR